MTTHKLLHNYAINICDLEKIPDIPRRWMIGPVCPHGDTIQVQKDYIDGTALLLECPDDQAQAICDIIRFGLGQLPGDISIRCYQQGSRGGWKKIPRTKRLT